MRFQLIGVNHKTAPVEVRERLAIPESRLPEACKRLADHPAVAEGMIVSTCNRVEFIANMKNGTGDLREFLREYFDTDLSPFESHLYEFREDEAIRHIFRVAASLDSMVVGEPQILGQVKDAYATARAVGAVRAQDPGETGDVARPCFTGAIYRVMAIEYDGRRVGRLIVGPFVPASVTEAPATLLGLDPKRAACLPERNVE